MRVKPYAAIAITRFKEQLTYRLDFVAGVLNPFIQLIVLWFIWKAVYASSAEPIIGGFTFATMMTYTSISVVMRSFMYPGTEYWVEEEVKTGSIAAALIKPLKYPLLCFSRDSGDVMGFLVTKAPILVFAFVILSISGPASPIFFLSVFLGFLINYVMIFMTAMWAFWTTGYIWGMRLSRIIISELASGAIVPLSFFPLFAQDILNMLPFQTVFSTPLLIYTGAISGVAILPAIALQLFWFGVLFVVAYALWEISVKRVVIQGG
jgi:ABC-2 type transport system permease protein